MGCNGEKGEGEKGEGRGGGGIMCIFPMLLKWSLSYAIITKTKHIYPIDEFMYVLFLVLLFF